MDKRLALMAGTDIPVEECQLIIHQPKIKEIALLGEDKFFLGAQVLCINKMMFLQDEKLLSSTTNFQIFMTIVQDTSEKNSKNSVKEVLNLFLPEDQVIFTPRSILIKNQDKTFIIDESNFDFLQDAIKEICCFTGKNSKSNSFNPKNAKAAEIARKLQRGRDRVSAQKGDSEGSIFGRYISILSIGLHSMGIQDLLNCTIYQIYDLLERYSLYTGWDMDIRSRLAGAQIDTPPEDWMKNIH